MTALFNQSEPQTGRDVTGSARPVEEASRLKDALAGFRSCVDVEVDVLGSPSLIVRVRFLWT